MHLSLVSKSLGQKPESKISRVTVDNITFSVFSKVRENSLSNVICSSQPHYVVKRWKYKAGTRMEISDSEQRLERWCLQCSGQMLVSQKLIFHCSLALLYFFFIVMLLLVLPTKQIVYELTAWVHSSYTCTTVGIFILCIVGNNCWPIFTGMSLHYCIWCMTQTLPFTHKGFFDMLLKFSSFGGQT